MTPLHPAPVDGAAPPAPSTGRPFHRTAAGLFADRFYLTATAVAASAAFLVVVFLIVKMFGETGQTWDEVGFRAFITGTEWSPAQGKYGALPAVYGTLVTSAIAMIVAVPLAIGVALATTVLLPRRLRGFAAATIDLLAAIPSVVYGLWGVLVLVPAVKPLLNRIAENSHGIGAIEGPITGQSIILAGLVLGVMILPIITGVVREVLGTVPQDQREAALALGATRWEMIRGSMLPWARSGIVGACALGLGRAVGETIAVALILGSNPEIFGSLLRPGQTLAGTIMSEYNSAFDQLHTSSLVAMGITLFALAFVVNFAARALVRRSARPGRTARVPVRERCRVLLAAMWQRVPRRKKHVPTGSPWVPRPERPPPPRVGARRRIASRVAEFAIGGSLVVAAIPLVLVVGYCVVRGHGALTHDFFTSDGEPDLEGNGIKHALVGTLMLMGIAAAIAVPLGILTALFMRECADRGPWTRRIGDAVGGFVDMLLGVPSIVAGLVISIAVVQAMGKFSALAGGLALALIMFPIVVRTSDEVLRLVPNAEVEAALGLGAPRWRTTWSVVLPAALPGILTGITLGLARVSGETAPLLLTSLGAQFYATDLFEPVAALPQYIFTGTINSTVPVAQAHSWGAAIVLVGLVLLLNLVAQLIGRFSRTRSVQ